MSVMPLSNKEKADAAIKAADDAEKFGDCREWVYLSGIERADKYWANLILNAKCLDDLRAEAEKVFRGKP